MALQALLIGMKSLRNFTYEYMQREKLHFTSEHWEVLLQYGRNIRSLTVPLHRTTDFTNYVIKFCRIQYIKSLLYNVNIIYK